MKVSYDKTSDAMYICLREGKIKGTVKVNDRLMIDVEQKGNTIGVELLDATFQLKEEGMRNFKKSVTKGIPVKITDMTPVSA